MNKKMIIISFGILIVVGAPACSSQKTPDMSIETQVVEMLPTLTSQSVEPTSTPRPTKTPQPTYTPTLIPTNTSTPTPLPTPVGGGGLIAYSSVRIGSNYSDPSMDIMLLNPEDGECTKLTSDENEEFNSSPSWSPDGSEIVYTKIDGASSLIQGGKLFSLDVSSAEEMEIESPFASGLYHPSWSQTNELIVSRSAAQEYPQLWSSSADELDWGAITPDISFQFNPVWSPDGSHYAFSGAPGEVFSEWFETVFGGFRLTAYDIPPRDIWIVDVQTGELTRLTDNEEDEFDPAWSPDGKDIAFVSIIDGVNPEIFKVTIDGSKRTQLTNIQSAELHPSWSPDGEMVSFSSNRDGNFEIYLMSADGDDVVRMTNNLMDDLEPVWSPVDSSGMDQNNITDEPVTQDRLEHFSPVPVPISSIANTLVAEGILTRSDGKKRDLMDFDEEWAQINWYTYYRTRYSPADFIIRADASWESASDKANWWNSGCGFVFREKDVDNHYLAYLDLDGFVHIDRARSGSFSHLGRSNLSYPLEKPGDGANIMLVVEGSYIHFFVDGYLMLSRQDLSFDEGGLALTLLSGTNKDFGTRCEMTNIELWELE